jgi:SnoaL-like domain
MTHALIADGDCRAASPRHPRHAGSATVVAPTGTLDSSGDPLVGQDEIRRWGEERSQSSAKTRHICSGMRFNYDGPDKAVGSTLLTVFIGEEPKVSAAIPSVVGEDHDEFVRTPEGWLFASRRFEVLFSG